MAEEAKKSNSAIKQAVIAVAVLVIICLVCVLLLALCNDLLYVSDEEKFNRTIRKVYSGYDASVTFTQDTLNSIYASDSRYGQVTEARKASDGSFVITAKGTVGAFNGGSVTILVAISPNPEAKILGWALQSNEGQTFIANITEKHQEKWFVGSSVSDVQQTVTPNAGQGKGSGATYTENALSNAINMACYYAQNVYELGYNEEKEVKKAVIELLGEDYADYTVETLSAIDVSRATVDGTKSVNAALSDADNTLKYVFTTDGSQGRIFAYVYFGGDVFDPEADDVKIVVVNGNDLITSENVTGDEDFVDNIKNNLFYTFPYGGKQAYAIITNVDSDTSVYTVAGLKVGTTPNTYVLTVTITDGTVAGIDFANDKGDGFVDHGPTKANANILIEKLQGATLATIETIYNAEKKAGATESANLIRAAVEAALMHYDAIHASND